MVEILIDSRGIMDSFHMDKEEVNNLMDYVVKEITARFAEEWQTEVNRTLLASREEYLNHLSVVDQGFARGAVVLSGWLPNAVEQGMEGWDMKEGFLNGPNAKVGKDGNRYNTIPFSWGVPGSLVENFNAGIMPEEVHAIAKEKPVNVPITLEELPAQYQPPVKKMVQRPISKKFVEYQHKNSIYEGISKRKDATTGQNSYKSFRRVSDNSDPDSWINKGIEARHIADKTMETFNVPAETGRAIDKFLNLR